MLRRLKRFQIFLALIIFLSIPIYSGYLLYCDLADDDLFCPPKGLVNACAAWIYDCSDAWDISLADIIEVEHSLDSIGLVAEDKGL